MDSKGDRKGQVSAPCASMDSKGFQARPTLSRDTMLSPTKVPFQNCVIRSLSKFYVFFVFCLVG
ncbi:hypothetical protein LEMLEM_LOCUS6203, partial [Lemmus lemmus]